MQLTIQLLIGIFALMLGIPIGLYLARVTREELKIGQRWFKLIAIFSLIGAGISMFYRSDIILFSFLFIAIVTGMSLRK